MKDQKSTIYIIFFSCFFFVFLFSADGTEASEIYWDTEKKCRKYTKIIVNYVFSHQTMIMCSLLYSVYCICHGNFDTSTWPLIFNMVVPFDTSTIWGWYLLWFLQFNIGLSYALCVVSVASYFMSCCFYITSICDDFKFLMRSINTNIKLNQNEKNPREHEKNSRKIQNQMHKLVELHVKMYEIFKMVAYINNGTIFSLLPLHALYTGMISFEIEHVSFIISTSVYWFNIKLFM